VGTVIEIGNLLKKARQESQMSLEELSKELKIQKRYLKAMEEGDFSVFAGEVYARGALRNYAEAVGLNQKEILSFYDQYLGLQNMDINATLGATRDKRRGNKLRHKKTKKSLPLVVLVWFALLVFIVGGSIWYRCQQATENAKNNPPPETNPALWEEDEEITHPDNLTPVGPNMTPPPVEPDPTPKPELILLSNDNRNYIYMLTGVEEIEIVLEFTGRCWVAVKYEGIPQQEKTKSYEPGEKLYLDDCMETEIRLGNPSAAIMKVNELDLTDYKDSGSAVNVVIKKGN
jgi:transcriptional regulator with XRE-family HTH domain